MKILIVAIALLFSVTAHASPYLVSDPAPHAVGLQYEIWSGGRLVYSGDNEPDGSIRVDLVALPMVDYEFQALYRDKTGQTSELSEPTSKVHATKVKRK